MNRNLFFAVVLSYTMLVLFACKKSDNGTTPPLSSDNAKIIGVWKLSFNATDANANKVLDASEKTPATTYEVITFNSNGTGFDTVNDYTGFAAKLPFSYSINNHWLSVTIPGYGSDLVKIYQLDAGNFVVQDTTQLAAGWYGYVK